MGASMAGHLLEAGYQLIVHNRTRSKAQPLLDAGALWADGPAGVARKGDIILTIVGYPKDVESVYFGETVLLPHVRPGTLLIDLTTSSPALAQKIAEDAAGRDCSALDAPVSGGDVGAREARLSIMVGGAVSAFNRARPIFEIIGENIVYQGPAGSGQYCKMANQIAIAPGMLGVCEAMAYARKAGLDPETVLESITAGAAGSWSLGNLAPRMLKGDFAPGFYVKHFIKDLGIALESAKELDLELPGLELAKQLYDRLAAEGFENDGTQALFRLYS